MNERDQGQARSGSERCGRWREREEVVEGVEAQGGAGPREGVCDEGGGPDKAELKRNAEMDFTTEKASRSP